MLRRIISVLDGSPLAESALPYAANLARLSGARLVLVQATPTGETLEFVESDNPNLLRYDPPSPESPADPLIAQQVASDARDYLASLARDLHGQGFKVETVVVPGEPVDVVVDEAKLRHADLIVMSTHGRSGLGRWLHGSVAEGVIARTSVPVLLIRAGLPWRGLGSTPAGLRLLVSLDGSPSAEKALPVAANLARAINAEISLVSVLPSFSASNTGESRQLDRTALDHSSDPNNRSARRYLDAIASPLQTDGLRVSTYVANNLPAAGILAVADEVRADIIVMATHGRTGIGRAILGSVALDVVRQGTRPAILVRPTSESTPRPMEPVTAL